MKGPEARARLLHRLRTEAWRQGTFTLASGQQSDFFIDCKSVVLSGEGHSLVGQVFLDELRALGTEIDLVAGVALGGCALASAVVVEAFRQGLPWNALFVRKEVKDHGTKKWVEGALRPGQRVVLLEDVLTTGGSALRALEVLRASDAVCTSVVALVDRSEGGRSALEAAGVVVRTVFSREDFLHARSL